MNNVLGRIGKIYDRRKAALYALSLQYAALALNNFRLRQAQDEFWNNQTFSAMNLVFSDAFFRGDVVGWFLAHGVEYGVYLELANDGKNQALRPVVSNFVQPYFRDAKALYKDR